MNQCYTHRRLFGPCLLKCQLPTRSGAQHRRFAAAGTASTSQEKQAPSRSCQMMQQDERSPYLRLREGHSLSMRVRLFMADDSSAPGSGYNADCPRTVGT